VEPQRNTGRLISLDSSTQYPLNHGGRVTGVGFDRESKYVITAGTNGFISFWDVQSGREAENLRLVNNKPVYSLAVSPSDTLVAAGLRGSVMIWDYASGNSLMELTQPGDVETLVFSNDGKWLASGSTEGMIKLWEVENRSITQNGEPLQLEGKPLSLSFSPDDKWLAGGGSSGFAYLWSSSTNEEIARIPHNDPVTSVSFSPDGSKLFSVSRKVVKIWDATSIRLVPKNELIDFACSHMISNFSQETWTTLFQDEAYRPLCPNLPVPEFLSRTNN
jgi:FOG: WD40 repeat